MFFLPGVDEIGHDVLPARTNKSIHVKARPRRRTTYKTNINYQVIALQGNTVVKREVSCRQYSTISCHGLYLNYLKLYFKRGRPV
jgi:hypothetical protein